MTVKDPFFRREGTLEIREMPTDAVPYAVFEGRVPTAGERAQVLERGYGVHLVGVPRAARDLSFLEDFGGITHLGIVGVDLNTRPVSVLTSLVQLELSVVDAPETDLAGLPNLAHFSGFLPSNQSILDSESVTHMCLQEVRGASLPTVPRQIETLGLYDARNVKTIVPRGASSNLRVLTVDGSRSLDLTTLTGFERLEALSLQRIVRLTGLEALSRLPLREIAIINCREVQDASQLNLLHGVDGLVVGRLSTVLRDTLAGSSSRWTFLRSL